MQYKRVVRHMRFVATVVSTSLFASQGELSKHFLSLAILLAVVAKGGDPWLSKESNNARKRGATLRLSNQMRAS